jgi:hypothetical protein
MAKWMIKKKLAQGPDIICKRHGKNINTMGWMLEPNRKNIEEFLEKTKQDIIKYIEDFNNDPQIKKQEERRKAAETAARAGIEEGYADWFRENPEDTGGEPEERGEGVRVEAAGVNPAWPNMEEFAAIPPEQPPDRIHIRRPERVRGWAADIQRMFGDEDNG